LADKESFASLGLEDAFSPGGMECPLSPNPRYVSYRKYRERYQQDKKQRYKVQQRYTCVMLRDKLGPNCHPKGT